MRELTFELRDEDGADPLTDVFGEFPSLSADSIASCVRRDRLWRIERFVGPSTALDRVEEIRLRGDGVHARMTSQCRAIREHDVLERSTTTLDLYTFLKRLHTCNSVMALAARHLDLGVVFQTRRSGNRHRWRLLMRSDENVDVFYEAVEEHLAKGVSLDIERLGAAERLHYNSLATVSLPAEQRKTVRAAIERGYYETPREITICDLAEELDVPRSTVSYRLRQAEAELAKGYLLRSEETFGEATEHLR